MIVLFIDPHLTTSTILGALSLSLCVLVSNGNVMMKTHQYCSHICSTDIFIIYLLPANLDQITTITVYLDH